MPDRIFIRPVAQEPKAIGLPVANMQPKCSSPRARALSLLFASTMALPFVAVAESECEKPIYGNQSKQNFCAEQRYRAADRKLNAQYKRLVSALPAADVQRLRSEQRIWLRKLVPSCAEPLGPREQSGNMWTMEFHDCMAQETELRTKVLADWSRSR